MIGMDAKTGRRISGIDHLYQSIPDILLTPIGTRIERRPYGSYVPELIDQPLNGVTITRLYAATAHALLLWEPRIRLSNVQLQVEMDGSAYLDLEGTANGKDIQIRVPVKGKQ
jgi:phage baseplate assembly protein W